MKVFSHFLSLIILYSLFLPLINAQILDPFPIKRAESAQTWQRDGWNAIEKAKREKNRTGKAKNVILFIGDGMGITTLTASRILEGQMRGESGEENRLFPLRMNCLGTWRKTSGSADAVTG